MVSPRISSTLREISGKACETSFSPRSIWRDDFTIHVACVPLIARGIEARRVPRKTPRGSIRDMRQARRATLLVLFVAMLAGCQTAEDRERAEFRERLKTSAPLSEAEKARLVAETVRAIGGRRLISRELGGTRELDPTTRAEALSVLTGGVSIEDVGVKEEGGQTLRGLRGPGTPARSELDATRTLWIDIRTLLPRRYELTYSLPGFGDYAYDLEFDR